MFNDISDFILHKYFESHIRLHQTKLSVKSPTIETPVLSFVSSISSLNCLTELEMYPLLHAERLFVYSRPNEGVFCPPGRES